MRLKILGICFKIDVALFLREVKLLLRNFLRKENPYNLINVLGPFSVILQPRNFNKVLSTLRVQAKHREKSQKYFNLLSFSLNLNHSRLWTTLGAMNFQKTELRSG